MSHTYKQENARIIDPGVLRARNLLAHVERSVWKALGYPLYGWVAQAVASETEEEEEEVATGLKVEDEAATGPKAFLGGAQKWLPGPVAEPVPKKLRGSVARVSATDPKTRVTRCPAARASFQYPLEDAATGPGDEDW